MSASESKTLDESSQPLDRPIEDKTLEESQVPEKPLEDSNSSEESQVPEKPLKDSNSSEEEVEEEEGECGFCLFMKAGGCRESFVSWENCIEEAEKSGEDIVEKCFDITGALKKCMEAHSDYYEPVLRAEKAAEAEAVKELEKEAAENSRGPEPDKKEVSSSD